VLDHEPLDELRGPVFVTETFRASAVVEQRWGIGSFALFGANDESGHEIDLLELIVLWLCDPPPETLLRLCEGGIKPA
jgi:hypothetical protein